MLAIARACSFARAGFIGGSFMLHRLFVTFVVLFWAAMSGLLVVREFYPESSRLNELPVSYVGRLLFQHLQSSDLQIYDATREVGYLHLQPRLAEEGGARSVEFNGGVNLEIPGVGAHRISWVGSALLDERIQLTRLQLDVAIAASGGQLEIVLEPLAHKASYRVRDGKEAGALTTFTTDEKGVAALLAQLGVPPSLLAQLRTQTSAMPAPEFTAQQSSTTLNGESVSTYLFSMKMEEHVLFDAQLSQLGQVLRARVPLLGYKLVANGIKP